MTPKNLISKSIAVLLSSSIAIIPLNVNANLYFKKPVTQLAVTPSSNTGGGTGGNTGGGSTATPNGSLTTSSLTFSGVSVGSVSSALGVSLLSSGTAPLTLTAVPTIRAGSSSMFTDLSSNCTTSGSLATGASCDVSVKFSPTNTALQTGIIDFVTNAGTFSVNLSGTGVGAPVGDLSASSITYSGVNVGSTSAAQEVLFQNTGNASLSITSAPTLRVGSSTTFNTLVTSCEAGTTLNPGQTCAISAKFSPTNTVAQSGNIDWETNAGSFTVSLSGTGVGVPNVTYSSNGPLSFGSVNVGQSSAAQTYTVTSSGSAAISITSAPTLTGADAAMFNITNNTCTTGATLAPDATCSFDLKFAPTAEKASAAATVTVVSSQGSKAVSLSGTGVGVPAVTYSTDGPLSFGNILIGQSSAAQTVTVNSTGTTALSITNAPSVSGTNASMFSISENTCTAGASISSGSSCSFKLTFSPSSAVSAVASISLDTVLGNKTISLTGQGVSGQISATGGTIYTPGDGYRYHIYSGTGSSTFVVTSNAANVVADLLVVGGGGGGGQGKSGTLNPGGGGAGGVIVTTITPTAQSYSVTVGAGGASNTIGSNSSFGAVTALGGGNGAGNGAGPGNGGSGGGAYGSGVTGTARYGGSGTAGQGNAGGIGYGTGFGGGGGGAGAVGGDGIINTSGGAGGAGIYVSKFSFAGASGYFGGGGAGGACVAKAGGVGGGGAAFASGAGGNGTANTGGGGGGGCAVGSTAGGTGGSGIVIIRYPYQ